MGWKGIVCKYFTPEEFRAYIASLNLPEAEWQPDFIVLHNTQGLTEPGGLTEQYLLDMEHEYRDLNGWSAGPHLFVDSERIWVFTPLTTPGIHANSWNNRTWGVEMEGDYDREPFNSGRGLLVQRNAVAAVAILSQAAGIDPDTMMVHRENRETKHHCPGSNVDKAKFIQAVKDYLAGVSGVGEPGQDKPESPCERIYQVIAKSGLNIRPEPDTNNEPLWKAPCGTKFVRPNIEAVPGWIPVLMGDGSIGWVVQQYCQEVSGASGPRPTSEQAYDFSTKEGTIAAIRAECQKQGVGSPEQVAYVLATTDWETGHTFKPVREAFWKSETWRRANLRYYPYYGRGFVQLTWEDNYRKYSEILGADLVHNPDLALDPKNAVFILVHGSRTGAFTGKKITDYIDAEGYDFYNARRCINGVDQAETIEDLAIKYLEGMGYEPA